MYHNPLGPAAATGIGAIGLGGAMGWVWLLVAGFTLIGVLFALGRILPKFRQPNS